MLSNNALLALASLAFAVVDAAPAAITPQPFASTCELSSNSSIGGVDKWLTANCLSGQGSERVKSAVYLPAKITLNTVTRKLEWKTKASDPNLGRCNYCDLAADGITYACRVCFDNASPVNYFPASIDLREHLANYAGHLLSNNLGAPTVPTTNIDPPARYWYNIWAGSRSIDVNDDTCTDLYSEKLLSKSDVKAVNCYTNSKWTFERLQVTANHGAWAVSVFDNANCAGTPFQTINDKDFRDFSEEGVCGKLTKTGTSVQVKMLWNGDI